MARTKGAGTDPSTPHRSARRLNAPLLVMVMCLVAFLIFLQTQHLALTGGDAWRQGDWLINFAAGPIRRGLSGEVILWVSTMLGGDVLTVLLGVQFALTLLVGLMLGLAVLRRGAPDHLTLAFLSPALLLFWVNDPGGLFRKEILTYAALSVLILPLGSDLAERLKAGTATALFALAVAFHEANAFFVGFVCLAIWMRYRAHWSASAMRAHLSVLGLIAVAGAAFALLFPSVSDTGPICDRLTGAGLGPHICTGIIIFLAEGLGGNFEVVVANYRAAPLAEGLAVAGLCAFPLLLALGHDHNRLPPTWALVGAALLTLPLFALSIDWGRWLSAFAFLSLFLLLVPGPVAGDRPRIHLVAYLAGLAIFLTVGLNHAVLLFNDGFVQTLMTLGAAILAR